jgi:peptidoglycan-N-acetylglucosamine deacetylase
VNARRRAVVPTLAIAAVILAACATIRTMPAWQPRPAADPEARIAVSIPRPEPVDVDGLDVRLIYAADPGAAIGARWAELPGNAAFNEQLRGRVAGAIDAQAAATGVDYRPAADGAETSRTCAPGSVGRPAAELIADPAVAPQTGGPTVAVVCEIVAASGPVLAEAVRIVTASGGAVQSDSTTVYYADTAGGFVAPSDTLITDDGLRMLLSHVVQAFKVAAGALEPQMKEDPAAFPPEQLRAWFSHFTFSSDGSLVLRLPEDFSTAELDALANVPRSSALAVTVPAADATPLLTQEGGQVQAGLAPRSPVALPGAPPRGADEVDCGFFACIALTFDDGPGPYTAEVLDALASRRSAATFFLQGVAVSRNRDLLIRMRDEGHQIANHSWNHPDLRTLPAPEVSDQIARTSAAIESITGEAPSVFRPPYGGYDDNVLGAAGLPAILWSLDTNDWQKPGEAELLERAVGKATPGDIVLLHDVHRSTALAASQIIDGLLARGFTLVTVEQLLGGAPAPGTATKR